MQLQFIKLDLWDKFVILRKKGEKKEKKVFFFPQLNFENWILPNWIHYYEKRQNCEIYIQ